MTSKSNDRIIPLIVILLITFALTSCGGRPVRKTMPDLTSLALKSEFPVIEERFTGNGTGLPFATAEISLQSGGSVRDYFSVALPDPADDSLAFNLLLSYKPLAIPLLTSWWQREHKGVLIDFRSNGNGQGRQTEYRIESHDAFSIPVVFLWDGASAGRAAWFEKNLRSHSSIQCHLVGGNRSSAYGQQDCFAASAPSLNGE